MNTDEKSAEATSGWPFNRNAIYATAGVIFMSIAAWGDWRASLLLSGLWLIMAACVDEICLTIKQSKDSDHPS